MTDFWGEVIRASPQLAVLAWVVWKFLRHIDTSDKRRLAADARRDEATEKVVEAFERNTDILARVDEALERSEKRADTLMADWKDTRHTIVNAVNAKLLKDAEARASSGARP